MQFHNVTTTTITSTTNQPPHFTLERFPVALPSTPPDILQIILPGGTISFLAGSFPIPTPCTLISPPTPHQKMKKSSIGSSAVEPKPQPKQSYGHEPFVHSPPEPILRLVKSSTRARNMLDLVMRGIIVVEMTWKEGMAKPAMLWREELEAEGKKHGANFEATYADLTRLLLIGKGGAAVSRYMGGVLTNNGLGTWEKVQDKAVQRIHKILTQSLFPACERLLLCLEDLICWGMDRETFGLNLPGHDLEKCISWVRYLATRTMELDREMKEESNRFDEFAKWARYEIAKNTAATDSEEDANVPSTHDVVAVCDYLETGFRDSRLQHFFLTIDELLDYNWPKPRLPVPRTTRPLHVVLQESLSGARSNVPTPIINSPRDRQASAGTLLSPMQRDAKRSGSESGSSPEKTRDAYGDPAAATKSTARHSGELWAIAQEVREGIETAYRRAAVQPVEEDQLDVLALVRTSGTTVDSIWPVSTKEYYVATSENDGSILRISFHYPSGSTQRVLSSPGTRTLAYSFFDDEELLCLVETKGIRRLTSIKYERDISMSAANDSSPNPMTFARSRLLKKPLPMSADNIEVVSLASNGRKGRRIACLSMGDGREMQVFDMSVDDDEDEDEDDDVDEGEAEAEESTMQHSAGEEEGLDRGEVEDGSRMEIDEDEGL